MTTFKNATSELLEECQSILDDVATKTASLSGDDAFNVSSYAKEYAESLNLPEKETNSMSTFVASLIRVVAMNSTEFENKRGRYGGMKRVKPVCANEEASATNGSQPISNNATNDAAVSPDELTEESLEGSVEQDGDEASGIDVLLGALDVDMSDETNVA